MGRGCSGPPVPICKMGTVSAPSARDGSEPHGAGVSPTGWLWGNPKPQAWGWLYVFEPESVVISGEETSALPKALSHGSFVFFSTHAAGWELSSLEAFSSLDPINVSSVSEEEEGARPSSDGAGRVLQDTVALSCPPGTGSPFPQNSILL